MTAKGRAAHKARFDAKLNKFIAKRAAHEAAFKKMTDNYVKGLKNMIDVTSDVAAEAASSAMLGLRLYINAFEKWNCTFDRYGVALMDEQNCTQMPNVTNWLMTNGKNFRKDVLKNVINVILAIQAAVNGTDFDPSNMRRRVLQMDLGYDFGDLNSTVERWMTVMMMSNER